MLFTFLRQNLTPLLLAITLSACASFTHQYIKTDDTGQVTELQKQYSYQGKTYKVTATLKGAPTFSTKADDIIGLPAHSNMSIELVNEGLKFEFAGTTSGINCSIWLHGDRVEDNATYRQLLQESLQGLLQNTSIGAQNRVMSLLQTSGPDGVQAEINQITDEETRIAYISELTSQAKLSETQQLALLHSIQAINSDYAKAKALGLIAKQQQLESGKAWQSWCETSQTITSDYELSELLQSQSASVPNQLEAQQAFFQATKGIESDYEKRRLLSLLAKPQSGFSLSAVLQASLDIESDYELGQLLQQSAPQVRDDKALDAVLAAAKTMSSSYELQQALNALPFEHFTTAQNERVIAVAAATIESDYELANTLTELLRRSPDPQALQKAVTSALKTISSDSDKVRVFELFYSRG
jgi:hypothetical protein